jgi:hypothetical protein
LLEHFSIIEELEKKREDGTMDSSTDVKVNDSRIFGRRRKENQQNEMVLEDEEEWSTCDEEGD